MSDTVVYLVRHAESAPDFSIAEADWPLSANGHAQAQRLAPRLSELAPTRLVSSPYRRSVDTIEPYARARGLPILLDAALRERHLFDGRVENRDELMSGLWADLDRRMPNCESGMECRRRVTLCLTTLADGSPDETLLVGSHGNAIALFLNGIDASVGHDAWKRMANACVFRVRRCNGGWEWDRDFMIAV